MNTTTITLLERLRSSDDTAAWDRFVQLYTPLVVHWAMKAGINEMDAADMAQEVMLVLLREMQEFQYDAERGSFRGYLKTITIRKCRDFQRRRTPILTQDSILLAEPDDATLSATWDDEYRRYIVRRALFIMKSDFEPTTWQACWETTVNGCSAREAGAQLGLSESAVYVAKSRVLKKLREELKDLLD
jgi:RNA polymerase sigma-70 factor (ECF subfamily)